MRSGEQKSRRFAKSLRRRMTKAEVLLWKRLQEANQHGCNFRRQHPVGPFIADFAHVQGALIVEVDGETHGSDQEVAYDKRRDAHLRSQGWRVMRISNLDVYTNLDRVVEIILDRIPPPAREPIVRRAPPPP
jgi:very-short-patch-repair endonuclease